MRPLRFAINLMLDGCYDHRVGIVDEELHLHAAEQIASADALILGRNTYELMESAWRAPRTGTRPEWMEPFGRTIDGATKYVVSNTLTSVDWNAELLRGDLSDSIAELKRQPGKGLAVGGAKLAHALTELRLIDEYTFIVHPRIVGHGPTIFSGLSRPLDLKLIGQREFRSGAVALTYKTKSEA